MQNRYVGDVGDFGKYGLLRWLCGVREPTALDGHGELQLGVVWYLHPDEKNKRDGNIRNYLEDDSGEFSKCDLDLHKALKPTLTTEGNRNISFIRETNSILPGAKFYQKCVHCADGKVKRENWLDGALSKFAKSHLIFVDPDNGIASDGRRGKPSPKHVYVSELNSFIKQGQSLITYHSFGRHCAHKEQVRCVGQRLQKEFNSLCIWPLWYRASGTSRVFFILTQPRHRLILDDRLGSFLESRWGEAKNGPFSYVDIRR